MTFLRILGGANQGQQVALTDDQAFLGRCTDDPVIVSTGGGRILGGRGPGMALSASARSQARILRQQDQWYLEEFGRGGTFVNDQPISSRVLLQDNDQIRVGDFVCSFHDPTDEELPNEEGGTTIRATLGHKSDLFQEIQSAEKLKVILAATNSLSKTLELQELLPRIADHLFQLFRQADRCFIILQDEGTDRLVPKVIKTRRWQDEGNARFSRTVVKMCLETRQAFLSSDVSADARLPVTQSIMDFRIRSVICAPLCGADGQAFGAVQLDTQDRHKKFSQDDLELLLGVTNQMAIALENARFYQEQQSRQRLERDMELAGQMQRTLFPEALPQVAGYEFFAHNQPALKVGGDFYDFVPLPKRGLALTLGDVAGKGIPAALLMAKLTADVRYCLVAEPDPAAAVARLNDLVYPHSSRTDSFVTLSVAVLEPEVRAVTLLNAGHLPPLIYRRAENALQSAVPDEVIGLPLGVLEGQQYESVRVTLQPGDCLLQFTDGVPDAADKANLRFQSKGIYEAFRAGGPYTPATLGRRIIDAVERHAAGRGSQHDDITLVSFGPASGVA
jgi:serine phosphatase RsbU (regulator of sigma subunit)